MSQAAAAPAPFREAHLWPVEFEVERRADGTNLITSRVPLRSYLGLMAWPSAGVDPTEAARRSADFNAPNHGAV